MPNVKVRITSETSEQSRGAAEKIVGVDDSRPIDLSRMASVSVFASAAMSKAKQAVSYGLSNYGNFTGDYVSQNRIDQTIEAVSNASTIAVGAMAGGWAGAIIATATVALNLGLREVSRRKQNETMELNAGMAVARSGNQLFDGSRGTEN